jgi:hypothetical protein
MNQVHGSKALKTNPIVTIPNGMTLKEKQTALEGLADRAPNIDPV